MTTQIAVRLPDELVAYVDQLGRESHQSRASIVTRALIEQRQRLQAETDARILEATGDYDDLVGIESVAALPD